VGSNTIAAMRELFPLLVCDPVDDAKMEELLRRLLSDPEFMQLCVDNALDSVKKYDYTHAVERWNEMTESV
jgi:transketolase C-terminal domain/subunit